MPEYVHQEYPKWVGGVVCQNADEEFAVKEGRAVLNEVHSAYGVSVSIASITPRVEEITLEAAPLDVPAGLIAAAQETFTRRKSKRKGK